MKIESFAILARTEGINGVKGQLMLTDEQHKLFCRLILGILADSQGNIRFMKVPPSGNYHLKKLHPLEPKANPEEIPQ